MKRSEALTLIANQLDFLNDNFSGMRTNHTDAELRQADVILETLEQAGMQPPISTMDKAYPDAYTSESEKAAFESETIACWEPE